MAVRRLCPLLDLFVLFTLFVSLSASPLGPVRAVRVLPGTGKHRRSWNFYVHTRHSILSTIRRHRVIRDTPLRYIAAADVKERHGVPFCDFYGRMEVARLLCPGMLCISLFTRGFCLVILPRYIRSLPAVFARS